MTVLVSQGVGGTVLVVPNGFRGGVGGTVLVIPNRFEMGSEEPSL